MALGAAGQLGIAMPWGCVLASDIVRIVQVIPAGIADFLWAMTRLGG
jgi:hypothetical protein